ARTYGRSCLLFTFVSPDRLNVDYFQPGGLRLDLGTVDRPCPAAGDRPHRASVFDPIIILFVLTIALLESVSALPAAPDVPALWLCVFVPGTLIGILGLCFAYNALLLRRYDRTGSSRVILGAFRLESLAKVLIAGHWVTSTLWLDWIGTVRHALGG